MAEELKLAVAPTAGDPPSKPLVMSSPSNALRLDLACGQSPREGFQGVDLLAPQVHHKVDLLKFPWPWKDNSVDELHCSHFVEHIHAREVEESDLDLSRCKENELPEGGVRKDLLGKDMLFAFFDECWRILKKDGRMSVIVPCLRSDRAFQDPTHRRFIPAQMFLYLHAPWRKENKLDHYRVMCNFDVKCDPVVLVEMSLYHPEAQAIKLQHYWNSIIDWTCSLVALK